jgi:hypothetical protein
MVTVDLIGISLDAASLIIVVGIALYGIRLIFIMRRGSLEKSWRFAALGSIFFTLGISLFILVTVFPDTRIAPPLFDLGSAIMLIGGLMLLQSFRIQYKIFEIKFTLQKPNEKIKDLS